MTMRWDFARFFPAHSLPWWWSCSEREVTLATNRSSRPERSSSRSFSVLCPANSRRRCQSWRGGEKKRRENWGNMLKLKYLDGIELVDAWPEIVGISTECYLQQRQEAVHAGQETLRTDMHMLGHDLQNCILTKRHSARGHNACQRKRTKPTQAQLNLCASSSELACVLASRRAAALTYWLPCVWKESRRRR